MILKSYGSAKSAFITPDYLINGVLEQTGVATEFYPFFNDENRKRITCVIMDAYYAVVKDKKVVFDTNRLWTSRMHQMEQLFENYKAICCVRNPAWIADSFEVIYRKKPLSDV